VTVGAAAAPVQAPEPPEVTDSGLPVRVRMAQLPRGSSAPASPAPELDPDAVGDMLARLYSGVRRADAEAQDQGAVSATPHTKE
jgi:hypothetical protein